MDCLGRVLGEPVSDPEEDAFLVFSQDIPSQSLGFVDAQAAVLDISVAGYDLTIHQSRGLLTSDRKEGTTGAVLWKVTPLFASWISSPTNFLFTTSLLSPTSTAIELGAGISGIVALTLGPKIAHYIATDQTYVLKLLRQNITENISTVLPSKKPSKQKSAKAIAGSQGDLHGRISIHPLDWELHSPTPFPRPNLIIACDCIYNESLIEPLNSTCAALCRLGTRASDELHAPDADVLQPPLVVIAQQLRSPDVFEAWLKSFHRLFEVWRVPDGLLDEGLREGSGFVVHVGVLRGGE